MPNDSPSQRKATTLAATGSSIAIAFNVTIESATGSALSDVLIGNDAANSLDGGSGDDTLDGGGDADTAVYSSNRATYTIVRTAPGYSVSGAEGSDTLTGVERIRFSDEQLAFDLDRDEAAGNTVRIIGAAFDAPTIKQHPDYVGIGLELFDGGMSMEAVCGLVLATSLYLSLAGSAGNEAFVNLVFSNVMGMAPSAVECDFYVGMLQGSGGTLTQAELLEIAANTPANEININLVGLQQSGVEFV